MPVRLKEGWMAFFVCDLDVNEDDEAGLHLVVDFC